MARVQAVCKGYQQTSLIGKEDHIPKMSSLSPNCLQKLSGCKSFQQTTFGD